MAPVASMLVASSSSSSSSSDSDGDWEGDEDLQKVEEKLVSVGYKALTADKLFR